MKVDCSKLVFKKEDFQSSVSKKEFPQSPLPRITGSLSPIDYGKAVGRACVRGVALLQAATGGANVDSIKAKVVACVADRQFLPVEAPLVVAGVNTAICQELVAQELKEARKESPDKALQKLVALDPVLENYRKLKDIDASAFQLIEKQVSESILFYLDVALNDPDILVDRAQLESLRIAFQGCEKMIDAQRFQKFSQSIEKALLGADEVARISSTIGEIEFLPEPADQLRELRDLRQSVEEQKSILHPELFQDNLEMIDAMIDEIFRDPEKGNQHG